MFVKRNIPPSLRTYRHNYNRTGVRISCCHDPSLKLKIPHCYDDIIGIPKCIFTSLREQGVEENN
jgi:hypothetical protein